MTRLAWSTSGIFLDHWRLPEDRQAPSLASLVREVLFVPPSMPVVDLLIKMRTARTHLALVVDEFGGIDGLATIEDLVEPIVGEIWDEHDAEDGVLLVEQPGGVIDAHARAPVSELEALTGSTLQDESEGRGHRNRRRTRPHDGRPHSDARRDHRPRVGARIRNRRRRSAAYQASARETCQPARLTAMVLHG